MNRCTNKSAHHKKLFWGLGISAALGVGCATGYQQLERGITEDNPCKVLRTLAQEHQTDFKSIRTNPSRHPTVTIWHTNYQVFRNACEIWGWDQGKYSYVCSQISPSKDIAMASYNRAVNVIQSCLSDEWEAIETPRKLGNGTRTVFRKPGFNTIGSVHAVQTQGLIKDEWSTYFFVGDYNPNL